MKNLLKKVDWVSTIFLTATPIVTVWLTWVYFTTETFNPWFIVLFLFFYFATGMSITGGYHRLFAHKSYEANSFVRFMYMFFGAAAFQNSIKKWATDHRIHHRYVDQDTDPYSINKGFWYAHFFWMCEKSPQRETSMYKNYGRDFEKDPLVIWQDKYYVPLAIFASFVFPALIGAAMGSWLGGLLFGGLLRMVIVHHFTFFINSLCHYWGYQPYTDENTAKDNGLLALFTYGEGYHNFHHIFHNDYRNGIHWYQYDPTKWMIKTLESVRFVKNLKKTPDYEIFKAKMSMLEKRALAKTLSTPTPLEQWVANIRAKTEEFRVRADEAHARWSQLMKDYEAAKLDFHNRNQEKLNHLRAEIQAAKAEFRQACRQWRRSLKSWSPATAIAV